MTGIERLRAQVEGGTSANVVLPRAMLRDILRQIERDEDAARQDAWESGYATRIGTESGPAARSAMLAEMADVTQALVNLKYGFNVTDKELAEAAWDCWERNKERGRW